MFNLKSDCINFLPVFRSEIVSSCLSAFGIILENEAFFSAERIQFIYKILIIKSDMIANIVSIQNKTVVFNIVCNYLFYRSFKRSSNDSRAGKKITESFL